ncbi:hypothetical protein [Parabacteroides goldsteinii]|uniref:hypothetical protein n=1 Tax=Parabacteroides goldsteinii TaxID=328812 RepID=UPI002165EDFD|nr:hypothetical protein [Parabacteroides goldsteinii]MCS2424400.1 hypothetical protein [Parabacteroides goldsteinii]
MRLNSSLLISSDLNQLAGPPACSIFASSTTVSAVHSLVGSVSGKEGSSSEQVHRPVSSNRPAQKVKKG